MEKSESKPGILRPSREQNIVLIVCAFIAGVMCVFPPYAKQRLLSRSNSAAYVQTFVGYESLFAPPKADSPLEKVVIDGQRIGMQLLGVLLFGGAAFLLLPLVLETGSRQRGGSSLDARKKTEIETKVSPPFPETEQIVFNCPRCDVPYKVPAENAGRAGECRSCGSRFVVPDRKASPARSSKGEKKNGWFSKIESREDALRMVKVTSIVFFVVAGIQAALSFLVGFLVLFDAGLFAICGFFVLKYNSRIASVVVLILSALSMVTTFSNMMGDGAGGGRNIVMAAIVLFATVRAVEATFRLQGRFAAVEA